MNIQYVLKAAEHRTEAMNGDVADRPTRDSSNGCTEPLLSAARARLAAANEQKQRSRGLSNAVYYGQNRLEEIISDIRSGRTVDALVTRNHYGCLVLNAACALFIDVDMVQPSRISRLLHSVHRRRELPWHDTWNDLRTVLKNETEESFRVYRTAAGFRILATSREYEPGSLPSKRLMKEVGADNAFVHLCRIQKSFRARLTPKPWRCGTPLPPNSFPRDSAEDQSRFVRWLHQYERACRDRATCQFLEQVGPERVHERIGPVIDLHDRESKAFEALQLA